MIYTCVLLCISVFVIAFSSCKTLAESELDTENKQNFDAEIITDEPIIGIPIGEIQVVANQSQDDVNKLDKSATNKTANISCILNKTDPSFSLEIVNSTRFTEILQLEQNATLKDNVGACTAVFFFSPSCLFSSIAAPHFNALPRLFPDIKMVAIDAIQYRTFNTQYGVLGTPTLLLFHGGKPAFKFNESKYRLEPFAEFITKHTGIEPQGKLEVRSADLRGPLLFIPVEETDYYLILCWLVIAARILYAAFHSTWGRSLADATLNAWREAEAQHHNPHEHAD